MHATIIYFTSYWQTEKGNIWGAAWLKGKDKLMKSGKTPKRLGWGQRLLRTSALAVLLFTLSVGLSGAWWDFLGGGSSTPARKSILAQGAAITDPEAILRYSLPIDNPTVRELQGSLEDISYHLRKKLWSSVNRDVRTASRILNISAEKLLATVPEERQSPAREHLQQMSQEMVTLKEAVDAKDPEQITSLKDGILHQVTDLEELMVPGFPFAVPEEYAHLPQLLGRATVVMTTTKGDLKIVVDGYSAPVNGGNFVDLVQRGFYDGLPFIDIEESFVLQTGKPPGKEQGFIDPDTGEYRAVPLEVLIQGDSEPIYGITLEDAGFYLEQPALPFNAYGAVAMARPGSDPNGGSSQFFFFKFDTELTPPGYNLMDGRYSVFGYLVQGKEVLQQLTDQDKVITAQVVKGIENLVQPQA